jgi:signal transduction histidine kinase
VRDEFLSIAGHELRTPLTALKMQLQLLERMLHNPQLSTAQLPERVGRALSATARLERLVTDLLDVARIASGRLALEPEACDLGDVVREVLDRFSEALGVAGCTLSFSAGSASVGRWDRARLDQVISNIVANAIKYGAGRPIDVVVGVAGERASVSVRDRGIGIAEADRWRIFERFERAVSERHYGGLGLGLWIANQIVLAHDGCIRVDSQLGQGATFVIDLPRSAS